MKKGLYLFISALTIALAPLQSALAEVKPIFLAGFEFGGDTLISVTYTDGSTGSIDAGEGIVLGGGVAIPLDSAETLSSRITLSWKYTQLPEATNGSGDFTRFPLDISIHQHYDKHVLGAGLTYHLNPKFEVSGVVGSGSVSFDDALGLFLQYDWMFADNMSLAARYTSLEYEVENVSGSIDANSYGIYFNAGF